MSASLEETLMGLGALTLDHDYDPQTDEEAIYGRTLQLWWGEELIWAGPLTQKPARGKEGLTLKARSHEFWLGLEEDGPVIEDREFIAGTNKLSNPGFELGLLYWRVGENTQWALDTSNERSGTTCLRMLSGDPETYYYDDVAQSDESFEAEPGMEFRSTMYAKRTSGSFARLRIRTVYEGKFVYPNIFPDPGFDSPGDWTNFSEYTDDAEVSGGQARIGPTTREEKLVDPSFEDVDTYWTQLLGSWEWGTSGDGFAILDGFWSARPIHSVDQSQLLGSLIADIDEPVGTRMRASVYVYRGSGADGDVWLTVYQTDGLGGQFYDDSPHLGEHTPEDQWQRLVMDFDIQEGYVAAFLAVNAWANTTGSWYFDKASLLRISGNVCGLQSPEWSITPGRSYQGSVIVATDEGMVQGELKITARFWCSFGGRDDLVADLVTVSASQFDSKRYDFTLRPPSGYNIVRLEIFGNDIEGGSFRLDNMSIVDDDESTQVFDTTTGLTQASYASFSVDSVAPEGTERVHLEVVAEAGGTGWCVDDTELKRINETISTSADVIDALCRDPRTDAYLVTPGTVEDDPLPYDLRYRNITCRAALKQFSRAVMQPPREWRIDPANVMAWGEDVYEARTFILQGSDIEVLETPSTAESAENSLQYVKVIGADRSPVGKRKQIIEAEATNSPGDKVDYFGNPWTRTRIVADSTVDHLGYAQVLADYEAGRNEDRTQNWRLRLSDWEAVGRFNVGDTILVYDPDSGLVDYSNEKSIGGETVWPLAVRVISRSWKLGNGFRAELRTSTGTTVPLDAVGWEKDTTAEIEVGTALPEFVADPMAGATGNQFLRFRASSPR